MVKYDRKINNQWIVQKNFALYPVLFFFLKKNVSKLYFSEMLLAMFSEGTVKT